MRRSTLFIAVLLGVALDAGAQQCGSTLSQCRNCHEVRGERPVLAGPLPWHVDHAFADLCARCHGGNPRAADAPSAHVGVASPLANVAARCGACHASAATQKAERYQRYVALARSTPPEPPRVAPAARAAPKVVWGNVALSVVALALALGGARFIAWNERRRGASADGPTEASRASLVTQRSWSPYVAGVLLGLTTAVSMAVFDRRISGSGAYVALSGYVGKALSPESFYWREVVSTGPSWELFLTLGMFLGALASSLASGSFKLRVMPDAQWSDVFGPSVAVRWAVVFFGTALIEYAAGIAGGCTAGLAVSGGAALAPGAFLFILGMFAGGIPLAMWLYRTKRGASS